MPVPSSSNSVLEPTKKLEERPAMKNILFIANTKITANSGGVGRVTSTLAHALIKRGYNICYYTIAKKAESSVEGVKQFYSEHPADIAAPQNIQHLNALLKQEQIHIIINQFGMNIKVVDLIAAAKPQDVLLITVHHNCIRCLYDNYRHIVTGNFQTKKWFRFINNGLFWLIYKNIFWQRFKSEVRSVIQQSDKLVLLSSKFTAELNFISTKEKEKIQVIRNPAPFEEQPSALVQKENRIVFVGILKSTQKRVERLAAIWKGISLQHPEWHLDIVGDGPERKMLEEMFASMQLTNYNFYGIADPRPFLEKAKFSLMTSDFEGFGMVLVESHAYGVLPVAFNSFAVVNDIIADNETGLVITAFDIEEYIQRLSALMHNESKRREMAIKAQHSVKAYELNTVADEWEQLFTDIQKEKTH